MGKIILASKSPRRQELLKTITEDFICIPSDAEEIVPDNIDTEEVSTYLATLKAKDIYSSNKDGIVIGCDTVVINDNKILGKPKDIEDAYNMIKSLSGKTHKVITGCCIIYNEKEITFKSITEVEFYQLSDDEINSYINTDEPYDKAGAYGIQGRGSLFVKSIKGDYFNVVGLPVANLSRKLKTIL